MSYSFDRVVKVECEWDIGLDDAVFEDEKIARAFVAEALINCDIEEPLSELESEGMVSFEWVDLISEG